MKVDGDTIKLMRKWVRTITYMHALRLGPVDPQAKVFGFFIKDGETILKLVDSK